MLRTLFRAAVHSWPTLHFHRSFDCAPSYSSSADMHSPPCAAAASWATCKVNRGRPRVATSRAGSGSRAGRGRPRPAHCGHHVFILRTLFRVAIHSCPGPQRQRSFDCVPLHSSAAERHSPPRASAASCAACRVSRGRPRPLPCSVCSAILVSFLLPFLNSLFAIPREPPQVSEHKSKSARALAAPDNCKRRCRRTGLIMASLTSVATKLLSPSCTGNKGLQSR
jgi:hypothetical protein